MNVFSVPGGQVVTHIECGIVATELWKLTGITSYNGVRCGGSTILRRGRSGGEKLAAKLIEGTQIREESKFNIEF